MAEGTLLAAADGLELRHGRRRLRLAWRGAALDGMGQAHVTLAWG